MRKNAICATIKGKTKKGAVLCGFLKTGNMTLPSRAVALRASAPRWPQRERARRSFCLRRNTCSAVSARQGWSRSICRCVTDTAARSPSVSPRSFCAYPSGTARREDTQVDYVRIDHFRGFEAYWSVPAGEETAINGKWIPGPDHKLFDAIKKELGDIPIIAEDLGLITEGVAKLRDDFALPGMKVLQFAFDANEAGSSGFTNDFLPHMYNTNCVVYTGTHDNDTMQGWLDKASDAEKDIIRRYLSGGIKENVPADDKFCKCLIKEAIASVAKFAVIPMQDIFAIGNEGRMNIPSTTGGHNWQWRMTPEMFSTEKAAWLKEMSVLYGRNL